MPRKAKSESDDDWAPSGESDRNSDFSVVSDGQGGDAYDDSDSDGFGVPRARGGRRGRGVGRKRRKGGQPKKADSPVAFIAGDDSDPSVASGASSDEVGDSASSDGSSPQFAPVPAGGKGLMAMSAITAANSAENDASANQQTFTMSSPGKSTMAAEPKSEDPMSLFGGYMFQRKEVIPASPAKASNGIVRSPRDWGTVKETPPSRPKSSLLTGSWKDSEAYSNHVRSVGASRRGMKRRRVVATLADSSDEDGDSEVQANTNTAYDEEEERDSPIGKKQKRKAMVVDSSDEEDNGGRRSAFDSGLPPALIGAPKQVRTTFRWCVDFGARVRDGLQSLCQRKAGQADDWIDDKSEQKENGDVSAGFIQPPSWFGGAEWQLQSYQVAGLNWLMLMDRLDSNAVLADEMGLGKTVQIVALLSHLFENGRRGPHLVVVPASTLGNWELEFSRWAPKMKVVKYHGSQSERAMLRQTTFARVKRMMGEEVNGADLERFKPDQDSDEDGLFIASDPENEQNPGGKVTSLEEEADLNEPVNVILTVYAYFERDTCGDDRTFLRTCKIDTMVLDEAHSVRNKSTSRWSRINKLKRRRTISLTGTPINNTIKDMSSLFGLVAPPHILEQEAALNELFDRADDNDDLREVVLQLMAPFVLRRKKDMVLKQLAPKTKIKFDCQMAGEQRKIYLGLKQSWAQKKNISSNEPDMLSALRNAKIMDDVSSIFTSLRKAANHPLLLRRLYSDEDCQLFAPKMVSYGVFGANASIEMAAAELMNSSDFQIHLYLTNVPSLKNRLLTQFDFVNSCKMAKMIHLLKEKREQGHRCLVFSQWTSVLDIMEPVLIAQKLQYMRLDGSVSVSERQHLINKFNEDENYSVFLLSTRAGGLGINLTAADTVILHDVDFNPQVDRQAEDRCHRVGQKKPVTVYRMITAESVDSKIYEIADKKERLFQQAVDNSMTSSAARPEIKTMMTQMLAEELAEL